MNLSPDLAEARREPPDYDTLAQLSEADRANLPRRANAQMGTKQTLPKCNERSDAIDRNACSTETETIARSHSSTRRKSADA